MIGAFDEVAGLSWRCTRSMGGTDLHCAHSRQSAPKGKKKNTRFGLSMLPPVKAEDCVRLISIHNIARRHLAMHPCHHQRRRRMLLPIPLDAVHMLALRIARCPISFLCLMSSSGHHSHPTPPSQTPPSSPPPNLPSHHRYRLHPHFPLHSSGYHFGYPLQRRQQSAQDLTS